MSLADPAVMDALGRRPRFGEYHGLQMEDCCTRARALIAASHATGVWVHLGAHLEALQARSTYCVEERARFRIPSETVLRGRLLRMPEPDAYANYTPAELDRIANLIGAISAQARGFFTADHLVALNKARRDALVAQVVVED
jgi:hypothetical protein